MSAKAEPLLIVDDDNLIVELLCDTLAGEFDAVGASNRSEVAAAINQLGAPPRYALIDLGLPPHTNSPQEGFALVRELVASEPDCAVVVVSGQDELDHGKVARTLGAIDFVAKPCSPDRIRQALRDARLALDASSGSSGLCGSSPAIVRMRNQIRQYAPAPYPVLIEGETGTGKELAAREIHRSSKCTGKFIALNCAAVPASLFEPTLFGAKRGSYTSSTSDTKGFFEEADQGTLLLDEVGDLPLELQPKLLRALETGEFHRVGDPKPRRAEVRIVAATNRPLTAALASSQFRDDLYHRLSVLILHTPALREMGDDRNILLAHFRTQAAERNSSSAFTFSRDAQALWQEYSFPGNVRELRNIIARIQVLHPGEEVSAALLAEQLVQNPVAMQNRFAERLAASSATLEKLLAADSKAYVQAAIASCGSEAAAAKRLGISAAKLRGLART